MFHLYATAAKSVQSCPTLCDPIDGSPSGSPVPGIFQARVLEWVAIAFSVYPFIYHLFFSLIKLEAPPEYESCLLCLVLCPENLE